MTPFSGKSARERELALFPEMRPPSNVKVLIFFFFWQGCQECQLSLPGTLPRKLAPFPGGGR
jgi:hypothetical protein